jgi:hypothetical protein
MDIHLDKIILVVFVKFVMVFRDQWSDHVVLIGDLSEGAQRRRPRLLCLQSDG